MKSNAVMGCVPFMSAGGDEHGWHGHSAISHVWSEGEAEISSKIKMTTVPCHRAGGQSCDTVIVLNPCLYYRIN